MMKKALLDYDEIRRMFNEKYLSTKRLIRNGETHLDNLAEGFSEADRVIWKLFFDADKPQTNADRIRAMSDEELAIMFAMLRADLTRLDRPVRPYQGRDVNDNYDWLQQPVEEKE